MEIFEAGNLSHQNLNINWTMAPNDKGQSKKTMVMVISSISDINTMTNSCCLRPKYLYPSHTSLANAELSRALVKMKVGFGIVHESD